VIAMPAKRLPPTSWIIARRDEGMTWDQIREAGHQEWKVWATTAAYQMAYKRGGGEPTRPRYTVELPWRIAADHNNAYDAHMLRIAGRLREGNKVTADERRQFDNWSARLRDANAVVHYTPEHGFVWVRKRPGKDRGLIREPETVAA